MKLVTFSTAGGPLRPGALLEHDNQEHDNQVVDLSAAGHADALAAITTGVTNPDKSGAWSTHRLSDVRLHAPLANPPRLFAIGLNYREHAIESKMAFPKFPVVFFKLQTAIVGPGDPIVLPKNSSEPDYEAELAFVIGKGGFRIPAASWRDHVYGYTIINDVSARDIQMSTSQWSMAKSFPSFCPMGPAIVTADEIADPHNLAIGLSIDGEKLQNSTTSELIFKIPELIEYLSSIAPLLPGDIVSTGTPSGVGMGRTPKRWLKPGENVTVTIEGLGSLTNPVVAE
ncbi:MAG TPA: fumarylacetoacetate hydrolase family protein [Terracidiphilus sp.]|jgi:2-keto-4-pentenoate hydratase/2-oxohepta-3-ene-1,7-dioic acid hydratase in catechol pathway|nr:fumarylacetoacetate hydrolase family protein [Terracidiphilus sp.]